MPVVWQEVWQSLRTDFGVVEREMEALDRVLADREASGWARATALVSAAAALCAFLQRCEREGVFDDIAEAADDGDAFRTLVAADLARVLAEEAAILELAGLNGERAADIVRAAAESMDGTTDRSPLLRHVWRARVDAAVASICDFPSSALVLRATNFADWVRRVDKRYRIAKGVLLAGANAIVATQMPEPIGAVKLSKLIAYLAIGRHAHDAADAPDATEAL